jgi:outer membrane protein TolC
MLIRIIQRIFLLLFFIIGYCFISTAQAQTPSSLTIESVITTAYQNNKDIQIQEREVRAAKAGIMSARSGFLPSVNMDASYTHNDKVLAENIFSGYNNDNYAGLSVNQSIYNGGATLANFRQSQLNFTVAEETLRAKKLDVEFDAKRLYYGLLLAFETERIAQEMVDQAQAHYNDVEKKFEQGTASKFDALQSKVKVSLLMPELVKAKNSINMIIAELNKLIGQKPDDPVVVQEKLTHVPIEIKEVDFLKTAYLDKPEMRLMVLGVDINKWSVDLAKAGYRPKVNALAGLSYRSDNVGDMINENHQNWNIGVGISIPIFDGFLSKGKVDAAKERYQEAILNKDNLTDQIAVDIRRGCLDLRQSQAIIDSQKDNVEEAREALRISKVSYDNGVATNLDVLDAQTSLGQVQQNLAAGIYDYLMAQAYLGRSMGQSILKEDLK